MERAFSPHNLHWESVDHFMLNDPQLFKLNKQIFKHTPSLIQHLPAHIPGIYTLGGGRQIGKTTLLKQWMQKLLLEGTHPESIFFLTGEVIYDHTQLIQIVQDYLGHSYHSLRYILIDEVTYIKNWDQGIKYLADIGLFERVVVILTGSDLSFMQEARMRFPGRRGEADQHDFHLHPLSFREFVYLKHRDEPSIEVLYKEFDDYLQHGGFLTAINSLASKGSISSSVYQTYSEWIRGDILKRNKKESYLKEVLAAIIKTYGSQVTWNSLADYTSVDHPATVQSYVQLLESMDVLFTQSALIEHKLLAAPKKAKKIIFTDPFIYHAINMWISGETHITPFLVESIVANHYARSHPCFYIKAEGEVDVAYVDQEKFFPVEVKWTNQLRPKDLKQIQKYSNGLILTKNMKVGQIHNTPTQPLPLHLYHLKNV